jgi:hypothetical protein
MDPKIPADRRTVLRSGTGLLTASLAAGCASQSSTDGETATSPSSADGDSTPPGDNTGFSIDTQSVDLSVSDHGIASPGITLWPAETMGGVTYVATRSGRPVKAAAFDHEAGEVVENYSLPTGIGCLALDVREDVVSFATRQDGKIHQLDRATGEIETVADYDGDYVFTWSLESASDGTLYASTSRNSRIYEIDPDSGDVTEIGPIAETEKYAYDLEVTESTVYVGVSNTQNSGLYEVDRETHEISRMVPDLVTEPASKVEKAGRYFVVHQSWHKTAIVDTESSSNSRIVEGLPGTFALQEGEQRLYYPVFPNEVDSENWPEDDEVHDPDEAAMYTYDLASGERTKEFTIPDLKAEGKGGLQYRTTHISDGRFIGVQNPESPGLFAADLESGEHSLYDLPDSGMEPTAVGNQAVGQYGGNPVTSRNGAFYVHDVEAGTLNEIDLPGEAKRFVEVDDTLYIGKYPGADFFAYDGESVRHLGAADGQVRPQDLVYSEAKNAVMMATQPNYGAKNGGGIGILDLETEEVSTVQKAVEDQSILSLATTDQTVYAGAQTRRGPGTKPVTSTARLASFDLESMEKQWEISPVDGAEDISSLIATPDRVIGIAGGTLFAVDPETESVTATAEFGTAQQHHLGSNGAYYGVVRSTDTPGGIVRIDPADLTVTTYQSEGVYGRIGESALIDGTAFFVDPETWNLTSVEGVLSL